MLSDILTRRISSFRTDWKSKLLKLKPGQTIVNSAPNRLGKTFTTLEYYSKVPGKILYLSDRHAQIEELDIAKSVHWYGHGVKCDRKDETFISELIAQGLDASIICRRFCKKSSCKYKEQFKLPEDVIVVAPKEYLPTVYVQNNIWDSVILDENLEKARKISYTYPDINKDVFDSHGVDHIIYDVVGNILDGRISDYKKADLDQYKLWAEMSRNQLPRIITNIKGESFFSPSPDERELISYLNNLPNTIEWISYCMKYGTMEHFYKPYVHFAYDLQRENQSKLVILNTSFDKWIYNQLGSRYPETVPEPLYFDVDIVNKDSFLFHYFYKMRSCSKGKITCDEGTKFGGTYGDEIYEMVKRTISFANKKGLKVGVITYKSLVDEIVEQLGDGIEVISYYGGHQGSNKLDDIEVLLNIGTFHLRENGLYMKNYIINNEFLKDDPAIWGGKHNQRINGMQINLTDNERLNRVKLYKLNEEHQQAIFRSGAHIHPGKLVVSFGYVPEGTETILNYKRFANKYQLMGRLKSIKDEIGPRIL